MNDGNETSRRSVLKASGTALAGAGGIGLVSSPAAAYCNSIGDTIEKFGIDAVIELTFCDEYIEWTFDHPVQSGSCRVDAESSCDGGFNFGVAKIDYTVSGSPSQGWAEVDVELCQYSIFGWNCASGTISATPDNIDIDI